jgi:selenocysteine lyase/cysteine desulfurase
VVAFKDHAIDVVASASAAAGSTSAADLATNEDYWREIQGAFALDRTMINLNNGGVCPSPRVVMDALKRYLDQSNQAPVWNMWQQLEPGIEGVRRGNASESLEICIMGLDLKAGDEILTTNQDYPRMITAWKQRERRDGVVLKQFSFPVPAPSMDDLYDRFVKGVTAKTKVILICHITNLTGQIFPVKQVCDFARTRGIEVIVDGAHAFGQWPFQLKDLDCDYYGVSLHKWMLAPIGTGFLYVRRNKIKGLWPLMAAVASQDSDIRKYEEIGTHPAANHNAIAEAIVFHRGIGAERKGARLRYLRDRWMKRLAQDPRFVINTSFDPAQSCAIGNVGIRGVDTGKLQGHLWSKKRIFTVAIVTPEYSGLRVMEQVAAKGLPAA